MSEKEDIREDLAPSYGDYAHAGVKAGFSFVPVKGDPISEFFSMVIAPPLEKRRDEWLISIYNELQTLKTDVYEIKIETLKNNEFFISVLYYPTSITMKTHNIEKIQALKNVVIYSAIFPSYEDSLEIIFLNIIDRYTPWHLKLLLKMNGYHPTNIHEMDFLVINRGTALNPKIKSDINFLFPELHKQPDLEKKVIKDLENEGLIFDRFITEEATKIDINYRRRTTNLGQKFLQFILYPTFARCQL